MHEETIEEMTRPPARQKRGLNGLAKVPVGPSTPSFSSQTIPGNRWK